MRLSALAVVVVLLSACSDPHTSNVSADVNAAAAQAQGDIDTYAANSLASGNASRPTARPAATSLPQRPDVDAPPAAPVGEPPASDDAQDAVAVARQYFTLLGARKYAEAWALWDDGGAASGMTRRQFADSFAKYATYRGDVGNPGRIDAGAGQRYVELPVRVRGTLADSGQPFELRGTLTLHRTGDIDGATEAQRNWHIRGAALKPLEDTAAKSDGSYHCAGRTRVSGREDAQAQPDGSRSGIWYRSDDRGNGTPVRCSTEG